VKPCLGDLGCAPRESKPRCGRRRPAPPSLTTWSERREMELIIARRRPRIHSRLKLWDGASSTIQTGTCQRLTWGFTRQGVRIGVTSAFLHFFRYPRSEPIQPDAARFRARSNSVSIHLGMRISSFASLWACKLTASRRKHTKQ